MEIIGTASEEPNDHESQEKTRERLFIWRLIQRARRHVCIICGEVETMQATCDGCKEARRQKRIAEDYYEGLFEE